LQFVVVGCPRCGALRVTEEGRKSAACPRCGAKVDLAHAPPLFASESLEAAQLFMGEHAAKKGGGAPRADLTATARVTKAGERAKGRAAIAQALQRATGRANQLKLILRRGFEAFGEVTVEDLDAIARGAEIGASGEELAEQAVELALAGRSDRGTLVPLREGR